MAKTFGAESTADEILEGIELSGKRVLVTGVRFGWEKYNGQDFRSGIDRR